MLQVYPTFKDHMLITKEEYTLVDHLDLMVVDTVEAFAVNIA